jgi:hypothetical protein
MTAAQANPMIGIVIPAFRQPLLLFDAVGSIAATPDVAVVIVDDGCPQLETQLAGLGLRQALPNVAYLRIANRGLSGARNAGVAFLLRQWPELAAIYFLDADNMLSPWSVAEMRRVLAEHPRADWFYPDIDMFGLDWYGDYAGDLIPLVEAMMNICEAGSLVRRRVFDSGLRFCETMRSGFEDWDFWLSAIERGFRGRHFPSSGFRYRKRPESMLAEATRRTDALRRELEGRHRWIADPRWAVAEEHATAPRYAILFADRQVVRLTSSPQEATRELCWADYATLFWTALHAPKTHHAGAFLIVTTAHAWQVLGEAGLRFWTLLDLEAALRACNIAMLGLGVGTDARIAIDARAAGGLGGGHGAGPGGASVLAISMQLLRATALDSTDTWIASVAGEAPQPRLAIRRVRVPDHSPYQAPLADARAGLVTACRALRVHPAAAPPWAAPDCGRGTPDRALLHELMRFRFGNGILPPHRRRDGPTIAFVLPRGESGHVRCPRAAPARLRCDPHRGQGARRGPCPDPARGVR